jgi:hypothetical protein
MSNQWINTPLPGPFLMGKRHGTSYAPISDVELGIISANNLTTDGYPDNDKMRKFLQENGTIIINQNRQNFQSFGNPASGYNVIDPNGSDKCWKAYNETIPGMNKTG